MFWHIKVAAKNSKVYFKKGSGKSQNSWDSDVYFTHSCFVERRIYENPGEMLLLNSFFSQKLKIVKNHVVFFVKSWSYYHIFSISNCYCGNGIRKGSSRFASHCSCFILTPFQKMSWQKIILAVNIVIFLRSINIFSNNWIIKVVINGLFKVIIS